MPKRTLSFLLVVALSLSVFAPAYADLSRDDMILLGLMFRNRFVPYAAQPDADPEVLAIAEEATSLGRGASGDMTGRYKTLIKGMALMYLGRWDEGTEVATILDMRLPAKLYEPGGTIEAKVFPVYEREGELSHHYMVHLALQDASGAQVGETATVHLSSLKETVLPLAIPEDAKPGRYVVSYTLTPHEGDAETILEGQRSVYVIDGLNGRLDALAKDIDAAAVRIDLPPRLELARTTSQWHHAIYSKGLEEDIAGAYTGHPIFMTSVVSQAGLVIDRMEFNGELELAETLAKGVRTGEDTLRTRTGDMRLAYRSPADGELVPFRVFVPEGFDPAKKYPLVIALHGAGGDENSFMDRYEGSYKRNAQERGYIVVSVNGRGPYGGYRGDSAQDVTDVLDLVQAVYPIDTKRTYLTGHSMGGGGTVRVGFDHADRFAALAPIAGFGSVSQLAKAKRMPLFIGQGDEDALVPVARARQFYEDTKELGMPNVTYSEKKGVEHLLIVNHVMDEIFDWFDAHKK